MSASIGELLAPRVVSPLEDASARLLLSEVCRPLVFDRVALRAAAGSFPFEGAGQHLTSSTSGVVGVLEVNGLFQKRRHITTGDTIGNGFSEGRTFRLELGPGMAACASFDATRRERAYERAEQGKRKTADLAGAFEDASAAAYGVVTGWSRKSRSRMVRAFASVDWSGLSRCYCGELFTTLAHSLVAVDRCSINAVLPVAMVTLTYPGDWVAVAATGAAAKRHLALFRQRWFRAAGWRLDGAWKLEFQQPRKCGASCGERAPHFHLLVPVPAHMGTVPFAAWLSRTWAEVVDADGCRLGYDVSYDPADGRDCEFYRHVMAGTNVDFSATAKMSDPKRLAVYFLKHGTKSLDDKEYQHIVPNAWRSPGCGPGRFWGFWGLKAATVSLDLGLDDFLTARRVLRRVAASRARAVKYARARGAALAVGCSPAAATRLGVDSARGRKLRTLGAGGQLSGGWVVVNDGPSLAADLSRAIWLRRSLAYGWGGS